MENACLGLATSQASGEGNVYLAFETFEGDILYPSRYAVWDPCNKVACVFNSTFYWMIQKRGDSYLKL